MMWKQLNILADAYDSIIYYIFSFVAFLFILEHIRWENWGTTGQFLTVSALLLFIMGFVLKEFQSVGLLEEPKKPKRRKK